MAKEPWKRGRETHHFLSDGVVGCLQVAQHLGDNLLGIAAVTHGVEEVCSSLTHADIPLSLPAEETELNNYKQCP